MGRDASEWEEMSEIDTVLGNWFDMDTGCVSLPTSEIAGEEVFTMRGYTIEQY